MHSCKKRLLDHRLSWETNSRLARQKKISSFMDLESSLPCTQEASPTPPASLLYPERDESNAHPHALFL